MDWNVKGRHRITRQGGGWPPPLGRLPLTAPIGGSQMISVDLTPCYYCGLPATSKDHAVPRALLRALADDPDALRHIMWNRRETVPCCRECNCLLGASVQNTLEERKAFLKERLRRRYAVLVNTRLERRGTGRDAWRASSIRGVRPQEEGRRPGLPAMVRLMPALAARSPPGKRERLTTPIQ